MKGYNTDFEILIYNRDDELHDKIIGQFPEGNPTIYDIDQLFIKFIKWTY
jgi:hypothetical protein